MDVPTRADRVETMSDTVEYYRAMKIERQQSGNVRNALAADQYDAARRIAVSHGWRLVRCNAGWQYNLERPGGCLYSLYPSNQRIYSPPRRRGCFVDIDRDWTLVSAVKAIIGANTR